MEIKTNKIWILILYTLGIDVDIKDSILKNIKDIETYTNKFVEIGSVKNHFIYNYKDNRVRDAIHRMKFNNDKDILNYFSDKLSENISNILNEKESYLILPVPSTRKRIKERGSWITKEISKEIYRTLKCRFDIRHDDKTIYRKDTQKQSHIRLRENRKNMMRNIFYIKKNKIKGMNIICIDDVFTTGSTISDIYRVCKESECKSFISFTVAH